MTYRFRSGLLKAGLVMLLLVIRSAYALAWLLALLAVGLIQLRNWLGRVAEDVLDQLDGELPSEPDTSAPVVVEAVVIRTGNPDLGSPTR
ncbi:hypothetical protein [Amycolatopsis anabasis]|uniref:hypothetical protein n=1 Tax=Amycolatopsis anabasis TaxID=1840409 RepID=UPI00131D63A6|nr:hypothetical protein [Amycolatopsis anabasis]